jgi:hypothetical protein
MVPLVPDPDQSQPSTGGRDGTAPRAMPTVLVFGLKPERLIDSEGRIDAFLEPPTQAQTETLVEAVRSGAEAGGHVLAIVPQWLDGGALLRLQMVESALDDETMTIHQTPLPPLAGAVLASLASALAPHLRSRGLLVSLLPEIEAELHVFTWLGSVSGLSTPVPTLGQHLASLSPGSAFGVSSYPEPTVHRLGRDVPGVPLPQIDRPARLAVSDHGGDASWITAVNAALGGLEVREVEPTPNGPSWWGTGKLVESVAYPVDVEALAHELVTAADPWTCRWCRELIARSPCPVCGHRGRAPRRRAPALPASAPAQPPAAPGDQHGART